MSVFNLVLRLATFGALVFIAVQLAAIRDRMPPQPITVADFDARQNNQAATKALEARLPVVRASGYVGVHGTVDVGNAVEVTVQNREVPVKVTNYSLPVTVSR